MVHEVQNVDTLNNDENVLVDFYSTTCGPCKTLLPVLEEISEEFSEQLKVAKVEVSNNCQAVQKFGVMSVPTIMFMQKSRVKEVQRGFSNKASIRSMIQKHMKP